MIPIFGILIAIWLISLWSVRHEIRETVNEYMETRVTEYSDVTYPIFIGSVLAALMILITLILIFVKM